MVSKGTSPASDTGAVTSGHAQWSSKWTFTLAAVGSAVGLGNIWKFPYEAGEGGGGAFVLIYLFFVFLIGTPVMVAELALGRRGQKSPIGSMTKIAAEEGRSRLWSLIGWSGVVGAFLVISFYSVVGGWTLSYALKAATGTFDAISAEQSGAFFGDFLNDGFNLILWHSVFMLITLGIVARGVAGGLEKAVTLLMPALFIMLIGLVIYAAFTADFSAAVTFLFSPDFSKVNVDVALQALGQSFFSLSLALGSIMTYGSYLSQETKITPAAITIAGADTGVALLAGLAIFPIVFTYGLDVSGGPGLIFATLPIAFGEMAGGQIIGALFFILLAIAAITSSISLLEPAVSYIDERTSLGRSKAAFLIGSSAFLLGILSALSLGEGPVSTFTLFGKTIMDAKDFLTNNIMMPLGGMFTALFVGWFVSRKSMMKELAMSDRAFRIWYFLVRFVAPVAIAAVFLSVTGLI